MNREPIYAALFDLLGVAPGLVTTSRKLRHWSDVEASAMPALYVAQGQQIAMVQTGQPTRWELGATLWIYVSTADVDSPGAVLNPIVDAVTAMLANNPGSGPQRLGGLVHYARIEGTIETSEGTLGDIEVVRIPVKMLAPD